MKEQKIQICTAAAAAAGGLAGNLVSSKPSLGFLAREIVSGSRCSSNVQRRSETDVFNRLRNSATGPRAPGGRSGLLEDAGQLPDVPDGVCEGLDLGERLSSAAVVRRKILAELMQRFRQTPHAQLLALARLHPPLHTHLHSGLLLRGGARACESGQRGAGRGRARGIEGLGRAAALVRAAKRALLSAPVPPGRNPARVRLLHVRGRMPRRRETALLCRGTSKRRAPAREKKTIRFLFVGNDSLNRHDDN